MDISNILNAVRTRLPGNARFRILKESIQLYKANPEVAFYKKQVILNIKSYFHVRPQYGTMLFERVNSDIPSQLYHVTERANLQSIMQNGLCNEKMLTVFLTNSNNYSLYIIRSRKIKDPVLLNIDTEAMQNDGIVFFADKSNPLVWIVNSVPAKYISIEN